jgi:hypothetical protein
MLWTVASRNGVNVRYALACRWPNRTLIQFKGDSYDKRQAEAYRTLFDSFGGLNIVQMECSWCGS